MTATLPPPLPPELPSSAEPDRAAAPARPRCGGCGRLLPEGAPGCGNCGRPVGWVAPPPRPVAPDAADADDDPPRPAARRARLPLFPVATHKFILLSVCTFGLYVVFWAYHHWVRIREATGRDISPFWRAVMAPVSCYWLFKDIQDMAAARGVATRWHPLRLAVLYFLISAFANLPNEWSLLSVLAVLPLVPAHMTTVRINDLDAALTSEDRNAGYSGANLAAIVVGGTILLTAIATLFLPQSETTTPGATPSSIDVQATAGPAAIGPAPVPAGASLHREPRRMTNASFAAVAAAPATPTVRPDGGCAIGEARRARRSDGGREDGRQC